MKVNFFVDSFPSISETFILNQITGLIDLGYDVSIIALANPENDVTHQAVEKYQLISKTTYLLGKEPINVVIRLLQRGVSILKTIWHRRVINALFTGGYLSYNRYGIFAAIVAKHINRKTPKITSDIVVVHFGPTAVLANKLRESGLIGGKLVAFFHGYDLSSHHVMRCYNKDYAKLFLDAEAIFPISEYWKSTLEKLGCATNKLQVHRMGIPVSQFTFNHDYTDINDLDCIKLISVARLTEKKGLNVMIEAASLLRDHGFNFTYKIVGNGPLYKDLANLIALAGLKNHVLLTGSKTQKDVMAELKNSNIFVLPSFTARNGDSEGIPVSLMEAMAIGKICISTYHSGIPELISDKKNGFLVREKDANAIFDVIKFIINQPKLMRSIRENAHETIINHFNADKLNANLSEKLVKILRKLND